MDLEGLRAFVAVVETGSLVGAARTLRFARATLRRRLDELEVHVGVPLLIRSDTGVTPTSAGTVLAAKARLILRDVGALMGEVREAVSDDVDGHLQLVCPIGLPGPFLTMSLTAIRLRFPGVTARLTFAADPLSMLETSDVAVFFGSAEPTGAWRSLELARMRLELMATREYLAEHGTPTTLEALQGHALGLWHEPGAEENTVPLVGGGRAPVKPFLTSPDPFLMHQLGSQGLGLMLVPHSEPIDHLDGLAPKVVVLSDLVGRELSLRLAVPAALSKLPRVRAIFNEVRRFMGEPELSDEPTADDGPVTG